MKAKVNLVEDKTKRKKLNPKGKKFKKIHHYHSSFSKPKLLAISLMESSTMSVKGPTTGALSASTERENRSDMLQKSVEENSSTKSTWWNKIL